MKAIIGLLCFILIGCATGKIPKYPTFKQIGIIPIEGGICVDNENLKVWLDNIKLLKDHQDDLHKLLEKEGYRDAK